MSNAGGSDSKYRIDFIDPLFAVAISIGFVNGLFDTTWIKQWSLPARNEWSEAIYFFLAMFAVVLSWEGYHKSIEAKPLESFWRFLLDIVLLVLYIFLLIKFRDTGTFLVLMLLIFVIYIIWDAVKVKEHYDKHYKEHNSTGGEYSKGKHLTLYWKAFWRGEGNAISEIITINWTIMFGVIYLFWKTDVLVFGNNYAVGFFVFLFLMLYRQDKIKKFSIRRYSKIVFLLLSFYIILLFLYPIFRFTITI